MEPHWDPATFPLVQATPALMEQTGTTVAVEFGEQVELNEHGIVHEASPEPGRWDGSVREVISATRSWIQYGTVAFAVICIVIGAVEGLAGR